MAVMFEGQVITGAVWSFTVMTWVQVLLFPHTSVALYVLVIVYLLAQVWLLITSPIWVIVTVPAQLSVAVTKEVLGAGTAEAQLTVTGAGQVITGGVWSFTVIICVHSVKFPHTSVALYVLVMVYLLAQVWLLITSLTWVTVTVPPQLSLTPVTLATLGTGTAEVQLTVTGAGQVITGGV